jgi:hypothetical protein
MLNFKEIEMAFRVLAIVLILLGGVALALSEHHEGSHSGHSEGSHSGNSQGAAAYPCPMLQSHHDQMTNKMAKMDQKVSLLAEEMKKAQGDRKIEVMESLLGTLVEQRAEIHKEMVSMMPKMMQWVSNHSGDAGHECSHRSASAGSSGH